MRKNKCHVCMSNRKITCEEKDCIPLFPQQHGARAHHVMANAP